MRKNAITAALLAIVLLSLFLNLYNIDFPLGYHVDEWKKVSSIRGYQQDFRHPILMLQVVRAWNSLFNFSQAQDIVLLGRVSTAIFGTLIVLLSYFISRRALNEKYALIVSLAVAVSPIMVIHSHYLKEDIIFTFFSLLALLFLTRLIRRTDNSSALLLGIATGLALSSKYLGGLLVLVYLAVPLVISLTRNFNYFKKIFLSLIISLLVFVVINYPLLYSFGTFEKGLTVGANSALTGHTLKIYPLDHFFSFHLTRSIIPGMTLLLTLLALLFLGYTIFRWKKTGLQDRVLVLHVLLFYFAVESSPNKAFPDFMRYVIPIIPLMIYFSYRSIHLINSLLSARGKIIAGLLIITTLAVPFLQTVQLDYYLNRDTREQAGKYLAGVGEKAICESYASAKEGVKSITELDVERERKNNVSYLVASSFRYDRFALGSTLKNQSQLVYETHKKYSTLFSSCPFIEIKPAYKSFAFSNPTIRIIDIRNCSLQGQEYVKING